MLTSYHVHSTYSDGLSSIREIVQAASEARLDEIGLSDHYVYLAEGQSASWSMDFSALPAYFADLQAAEDEFRGRVVVRRGLEADFDPQSARELAEVLSAHPFDYVIGSVHFIDGFPVDESGEHWDGLTEPERNDMMRAYWSRIAGLARSCMFSFVGHLDLYKKFGHLPTADLSAEVAEALDAIAEAGMAVEVNTAGWNMRIDEAYPSPALLAQCHRRSIPVLINADAHIATALTMHYERARELIRSAGYSQTAIFSGRKLTLAPM